MWPFSNTNLALPSVYCEITQIKLMRQIGDLKRGTLILSKAVPNKKCIVVVDGDDGLALIYGTPVGVNEFSNQVVVEYIDLSMIDCRPCRIYTVP